MSEVNINLNNLSQKAHDEFTIEYWESEGQQVGTNGARFVRFVFDGRYGADLRDKDKPKTYIQLMEEIKSLKAMIVEARPYVEYAVKYSTPLSQKIAEQWLTKTENIKID